MKLWKLDRIISIATLLASVVAIVLVLKKPAPVAPPQTPAATAANAQSFQDKLAQLEQASSRPTAVTETTESPSAVPAQPSEVHINSDEVNAALAQATGAMSGAGSLTPNSELGPGTPTIKDQQVSFEGDTVHGQFLVTVAGKDVWLTLTGHLGSKDGYATFEPTEIKLGDMNVPVSLVNGVLQKKLAEQRDKMKLPDSVGGMKVQNGELVLQPK